MSASQNGHNGNRVFNDKAIAYALATVAAFVYGSLAVWTLSTSLDTRDRVVRMEVEQRHALRRLDLIEGALYPTAAPPQFRGRQ